MLWVCFFCIGFVGVKRNSQVFDISHSKISIVQRNKSSIPPSVVPANYPM